MYFSPNFVDTVISPYSKEEIPSNLRYQRKLKKSNFDYLDIELNGDAVFFSYLPNTRKEKAADYWKSPQRQKARPGSVLKKLLDVNDKELERFIDLLKKDLLKSKAVVELYPSKIIPSAYALKNALVSSGGSTLAHSCMRNKPSNYFDIYAKNPKACSILLAKREDKIVARALHWNGITEGGDKISILDRVYYITPLDEKAMFSWAEKNCDIYKNASRQLIETKTGKHFHPRILIPLEKSEFDRYPYLDTFLYLDKKESLLANSAFTETHYLLQDQNGTCTSETGYTKPIPEGQVYIPYKNKCYLIDKTQFYFGARVLKTELETCIICEEIGFKNRLHHLRDDKNKSLYSCTNHYKAAGCITHGKIIYKMCGGCVCYCTTTDSKGYCKFCMENRKKCAGCKDPLPISRNSYYTLNNKEFFCFNCYSKKVTTCSRCYTNKLKEACTEIGQHYYCKACSVIVVKTCGGCSKAVDRYTTYAPTIGGITYCNKCYQGKFKICKKCGYRKLKDEINKGYCKECQPVRCKDCKRAVKVGTDGICARCEDEPFA